MKNENITFKWKPFFLTENLYLTKSERKLGFKVLIALFCVLISTVCILVLIFKFPAQEPSDLVLWLKFDGDLNDSSPNGFHGYGCGVVKFAEGRVGKALLLEGNGYIRIYDKPQFSIVNNPNGMTISFWICPSTRSFKTANEQGYIRFLGKGDVRKHEWCFTIYNASNPVNRPYRIAFYIHNATGGFGIGTYFEELWDVNEWIFITGVMKNGILKIYKNGIYKRSSYNYSEPNPIGMIFPEDTDSPLCIGKRFDVEEYFEGKIDDFRIYNRALNDTEIKDLFGSYFVDNVGLQFRILINHPPRIFVYATNGSPINPYRYNMRANRVIIAYTTPKNKKPIQLN